MKKFELTAEYITNNLGEKVISDQGISIVWECEDRRPWGVCRERRKYLS